MRTVDTKWLQGTQLCAPMISLLRAKHQKKWDFGWEPVTKRPLEGGYRTGYDVEFGDGESSGEGVSIGVPEGVSVGVASGDSIGDSVGLSSGDSVGDSVGEAVGDVLGVLRGDSVGDAVGDTVCVGSVSVCASRPEARNNPPSGIAIHTIRNTAPRAN